MSELKDTCAWKGCTKERVKSQFYGHCEKCYTNLSGVDDEWCYDHREGTDPSTGCSYMPPYFYSCLNCYPKDFDNWIPNENQWGPIQKWKDYLAKARTNPNRK